MRKTRKNEKGFTMVELIIVVAIMGIIGALLVPAYSTMTTKARVTTDLNTVKTIKRTAESYKAETGTYPAGTDLASVSATLKTAGYLDEVVALQTAGATAPVTTSTGTFDIKLNLTAATDPAVSKAVGQMSADAKAWIVGQGGTAS